jgi:hypothetical protein
MARCTICKEKKDEVKKCKECGQMFCNTCGDYKRSYCEDCKDYAKDDDVEEETEKGEAKEEAKEVTHEVEGLEQEDIEQEND